MYGRASETPKVSATQRLARLERDSLAIAAVRTAFEEIVIFFRANRKQTELREPRIGIDDDAVRLAHGFAQLRPDGQPVVERSRRGRTRSGDAASADRPRTVPSFCAGRRTRCGRWGSAASLHPDRTLVTATSAPSVTRERTKTFRSIGIAIQTCAAGERARSAPPNDRHASPGIAPRDHIREQVGVDVAQARLEQIAQPFHDDAEERAVAIFGDQIDRADVRATRGRCQAVRQQILAQRDQAGGTFQPATPAFLRVASGTALRIGDQRVRQRRAALAFAHRPAWRPPRPPPPCGVRRRSCVRFAMMSVTVTAS